MVSKRLTKYKNSEEENSAKQIDLQPLTENQGLYLQALKEHQQILVFGPSGTGKTFVAATFAANLYLAKVIDKIIITRPNVSVGKSMGSLPGTLNEKLEPLLSPVIDVLNEQLGRGVVETAIKNGNIEMAPLEYMRGRSFKDAFILLDEGQNLTVPEFKMFVTRVGENCKLVINGDIRQSDIKEGSGLSKAVHLAKKYHIDVGVIEFNLDDVVRGDLCKDWLTAFYEEGI